MVLVLEKGEGIKYLTSLEHTLRCAKKDSSFTSLSFSLIDRLKVCVELLKFKLENGLSESVSFNDITGVLSFNELSRLISEKRALELRKSFSYSPEQIQENLIKFLDQKSLDELKEVDIGGYMSSLSDRYYMAALDNAKIDNLNIVCKILEESRGSNLYNVSVSAYSNQVGTFVGLDAEFFVKNSKFNNRGIKINNDGTCTLDEDLKVFFTTGVDQPSNLLFHHISNLKGYEPRRVCRTLMGPILHEVIPLSDVSKLDKIDPNLKILLERFGPFPSPLLTLHNDDTTQNLATEEGDPSLEINHTYFSADSEVMAKLKGAFM